MNKDDTFTSKFLADAQKRNWQCGFVLETDKPLSDLRKDGFSYLYFYDHHFGQCTLILLDTTLSCAIRKIQYGIQNSIQKRS